MSRLSRFVLVSMVASVPALRATTMIYPVEAIDDLWNLPAEEFRAKYAGINITGLGPSDEGWYVRYKHENLTCLFGPLPDREQARSKKWDMETVRDAAIRNRASLSTSQVDFVRFTFSGVFGKGGGDAPYGGGQRARISADGKSGPDGDLDGDGIPNSKDPDMDGDGIPNERDDDIDGDGIPNGKDDYSFGSDPGVDGHGNGGVAKDGTGSGDGTGDGSGEGKDGKGGKGGKGGKNGSGSGDGSDGDQLAGGEGSDGSGQGGQGGSKGGRKSGQGGGQDGGSSGSGGQQGGQGGRQVASNSRGGQQGGQGGQSGQAGQSGQSGGQQGGSQGGSSGGGGAAGASGGQPGGGPAGAGSSGGGGNPLSLLTGLLKMILGL